ncbi:MAG TPA: hypothetical protein VKV95_11925, partial [Terriglobia bacterium]|nr:hypothetical protein [Terriglobia bacterium]
MRNRHHGLITASLFALILGMFASVGYGADKSTAKLLVRVRPVEAEIFIDGQHMGDATWNGMMTVPKIS